LSVPAPYAELLRQAQALWRSERPAEARRLLERLLELAPHDVEALILSAHLAMQAGEPEAAMRAVDLAATLAPGSAAVQHTRGRVLQARGEPLLALPCFQQAARAAPTNADVLTSLGNALQGLGRMEESIVAYRQALTAKPGYLPAIGNLARVLEALGDLASAGALREAAGQAAVTRASELQRRALELAAQGRPRAALDLLQDVLALTPNPETLHAAAELAGDCSDYQLGLDYLDRLLALESQNAPALRLGCVLSVGGGLLERLPHYTQCLRSLAPADELLTLVRLALPPIQQSRASIAATRAAYEATLDELLQGDFTVSDPAVLGLAQPFFLAYHGECNRDLHIKAARMYARALPSLLFVAPHCRRPQRPGKIRIGFISRYFNAHAIGKISLGLVEKIDRRRFEVYVVRVNPGRDDETTARFRAAADHFVPVSGDLRRLAETHQLLAALELDILFYQDIGMEASTYFLSFARLAPLQCTFFGHPDTTGVPSMDCFISNDLYETADSPAHYSERLVLLRDLPTCSYYYRPPVPSGLPRRAALGLPEDATIYICPQTLFKFHPDFDALLKGILERDPRGRLVLIQAGISAWNEQLLERFRRTMPEVVDRVLFLPAVPHAQFMQLLASSDVMLDPIHFNGANTSLEGLASGTPVVTLPTGLQRGRHTRAMYLKMGVSDCIAADATDYIDIAVRLGTDPQLRGELRARILARNDALYEDPRVLSEFERFFAGALEEQGPLTG
jgi:predicted O-linked N-acetylglucosamine transferase (SPINDLY family)